jgi:Glyoxalase-like domain
MLRLDHIAIACERLDDGVTAVEAALGVPMAGGGKHALMGTHNRLLALGDIYLEVIAIDPGAPPPGRPRWFDLDRFAGPPRLTNWVVACDDITGALAAGPPGWGRPLSLERGEFRWQMAVPDDGRLPFDNACPALIQWDGARHPLHALPASGLELHRLEITHPQAEAIGAALPGLTDPRVVLREGPTFALQAMIDTPAGLRVI